MFTVSSFFLVRSVAASNCNHCCYAEHAELLASGHESLTSPYKGALDALLVIGASDMVSDDEVPTPYLHVPSPPQFSDQAVATFLAGTAATVLVSRFPPILLWFHVTLMLRFLFRVLHFLAFPPLLMA